MHRSALGLLLAIVVVIPAPAAGQAAVPEVALTTLVAFVQTRHMGAEAAAARAYLTPRLATESGGSDRQVAPIRGPAIVVTATQPDTETVTALVRFTEFTTAGPSGRAIEQTITLRRRGACWAVDEVGLPGPATGPLPPGPIGLPLRPLPAVATDCAWAIMRARFPPAVSVVRPTWLPARFAAGVWPPVPGPFYGIVYVGTDGDLLAVTIGPTNSARGAEAEPITVRGIPSSILVSDGSPPLQVAWVEQGVLYSVRAERGLAERSTLTVAELRRIVASLAAVGPDGRPSPTVPATGAGGLDNATGLDGLALVALASGLGARGLAVAWRRRRTGKRPGGRRRSPTHPGVGSASGGTGGGAR